MCTPVESADGLVVSINLRPAVERTEFDYDYAYSRECRVVSISRESPGSSFGLLRRVFGRLREFGCSLRGPFIFSLLYAI